MLFAAAATRGLTQPHLLLRRAFAAAGSVQQRSHQPPLPRFNTNYNSSTTGNLKRVVSPPAAHPSSSSSSRARSSSSFMPKATTASTTTAISNKRKMTKIGTHDGSFHCDEALGCFLLQHTAAYDKAEVVRSRDPEVLSTMDVVIDVGAVYEPENNKFDHHQRGFEEIFGHGFVTKLSSAGLVYKHFGREIVARVLEFPQDDPRVEKIYLKVYKSFVEAVDGIDNGVNQWESDKPAKYTDNTGLSARVGKLNPAWNEDNAPAVQLAQFHKAMALAGGEFMDAVKYYGLSWLPARQYVEQALGE